MYLLKEKVDVSPCRSCDQILKALDWRIELKYCYSNSLRGLRALFLAFLCTRLCALLGKNNANCRELFL